MTKALNSMYDIHVLPRVLNTLLNEEADRRYKHSNAKKIQRKFREALSNPYNPICQRRLMYEYDSLQQSKE